MKMWEEAPQAELFGIRIYSFGLYCMIGAVVSVAAIWILCRFMKTKKGTDGLLSLLSVVFGIVCSRITYFLLDIPISGGMPVHVWFRISAGGFSLFGMISGTFLASWLYSRLTGQSSRKMLDIVSCAVPLMIAAERLGERYFEGFDISRPILAGNFPDNTFLAYKDTYYEDIVYLETYFLAGICAIALFLVLVFFLTRSGRREGDTWILFMILCGTGGVLLESLRDDRFLEFSFVYFQQIIAMLLLIAGVVMAGLRTEKRKKKLFAAAGISLPVCVLVCIAAEFAFDRTKINHYLLYAIMTAVLAVPATLGIFLLEKREKGKIAH